MCNKPLVDTRVKGAGSQRLNLIYDNTVLMFCFKSNSRPCIEGWKLSVKCGDDPVSQRVMCEST